ncbi:MAG: hypothetical protein M3422_06185, partial [Actinomycetota bacterium]|nr:hypothetical protein [Actinomycetota bacterium]
MSGLPLDDSPDGAPGLASGVFPHFESGDAADVPRLATGDLEWHEVRDALWLAHMLRPATSEPAPEPPAPHGVSRPPDTPATPSPHDGTPGQQEAPELPEQRRPPEPPEDEHEPAPQD